VELVATTGSIARTDQFGKRASILGGSLLFGLATLCLAATGSPPVAIGLGLLVLAVLGFEFAFVSALPLVAELDPAARATAVGIALGTSTVARSVGSVVGSELYVEHGFSSLMVTSSVCTLLTMAVTLALVREP
jgi:predicted MFS family arabinose efflux permease